MNDIYLLTGGNLGDRLQNLTAAQKLIERNAGLVVKVSGIYETAAWGFTEQASFLNQVLCIHSNLDPTKLLHCLLQIELELGRIRVEKMGPRLIDIDILFYDDQVISTAELVVPHPRIQERRFVLTPLNEIAPDFTHPVLQKTVKQLLDNCSDELEVIKYMG